MNQGDGLCRTRFVLGGACLSATLVKSRFPTSHIVSSESKYSLFPQGKDSNSFRNKSELKFMNDLVVVYLCLLLLGTATFRMTYTREWSLIPQSTTP